nr:NADH dehydrogenase subunit 4 [Ibidoecus bisignatus]
MWITEMLICFLSLFFFLFVDSLLFFLSMMMLYQLFISSNFFSFLFTEDWLSNIMMFMSMSIYLILFLICSKKLMKLIIISMMITTSLFFMSGDLMLFFLMFEFSLIPMMMMMMFFGNQAERLKSMYWMLMYTLISSFPFFMVLMYMMNYFCIRWTGSMFLFSNFDLVMEKNVFYFMMFISFLVKIPSFFLHSWLPKAHVEASLEGSMLLAGLMLKMGGYGMLRFMLFFKKSFSSSFFAVLFIIFSLGTLISSLMVISSDDMKVMVAYSSVSHMNFMLLGLNSMKLLSTKSVMIIMFSHSMTSCILFYLVTEVYSKIHSRSILIGKGMLTIFQSYFLLSFIAWAMNMSAPPSLSFIGELLSIICLFNYSFLVNFSCFILCLY